MEHPYIRNRLKSTRRLRLHRSIWPRSTHQRTSASTCSRRSTRRRQLLRQPPDRWANTASGRLTCFFGGMEMREEMCVDWPCGNYVFVAQLTGTVDPVLLQDIIIETV